MQISQQNKHQLRNRARRLKRQIERLTSRIYLYSCGDAPDKASIMANLTTEKNKAAIRLEEIRSLGFPA